MALYSMRSERAFCERLNYDLLFKWFLDLPIDAKAFDPTTFTKNRDRLLAADIVDRFLIVVVRQATMRRYVSSEHFSVDGTLLEAWASHKSFKPKDDPGPGGPAAPGGRNVEVDFHGEKRSNKTHRSTTDPEARLARKSAGTPARLGRAGHLLMEHRNALIVEAELTQADGYAERATAIELLARLPRRKRGEDGPSPPTRATTPRPSSPSAETSVSLRTLPSTPTADALRSTGRTTRHPGHRFSQRTRPRIEEPFGWIKTVGGGRKLRYKGRELRHGGMVPAHRRHLQPDTAHRTRRQHRIREHPGEVPSTPPETQAPNSTTTAEHANARRAQSAPRRPLLPSDTAAAGSAPPSPEPARKRTCYRSAEGTRTHRAM